VTKLGLGLAGGGGVAFSVVVHPIIPSKQTVNAIVSAGLILAFFSTSFCASTYFFSESAFLVSMAGSDSI
jgi:hypothetical protein